MSHVEVLTVSKKYYENVKIFPKQLKISAISKTFIVDKETRNG